MTDTKNPGDSRDQAHHDPDPPIPLPGPSPRTTPYRADIWKDYDNLGFLSLHKHTLSDAQCSQLEQAIQKAYAAIVHQDSKSPVVSAHNLWLQVLPK